MSEWITQQLWCVEGACKVTGPLFHVYVPGPVARPYGPFCEKHAREFGKAFSPDDEPTRPQLVVD